MAKYKVKLLNDTQFFNKDDEGILFEYASNDPRFPRIEVGDTVSIVKPTDIQILSRIPYQRNFGCIGGSCYQVIEEKANLFGIYFNQHRYKTLLMHQRTRRKACNIAKLLAVAYNAGHDYAIE